MDARLHSDRGRRHNAAGTRNQQAATTKEFTIQRGITLEAHKIVLYGTGGCGKSELCSLLGQLGIEVLFLDVDN